MTIAAKRENLSDQIGLELLNKTAGVLRNASPEEFATLVQNILSSSRVFICGAGRSGLVGRLFAMRLMHLGKTVYVVGDTTTPSIGASDLLICISSSGKTRTVLGIANLAQQANASVTNIGLNIGTNTPLSELANFNVLLDRRVNSHMRQTVVDTIHPTERKTMTPLGTVFEIATLIYLESIIAELIRYQQVSESEMKLRHTNLE